MPAFLHQRDSTRLRLATSRHDPSIHNDGLIEFGGETVAGHIPICRNPVVDAHANHGSCWQGQTLRGQRLVRLSLGLSIGLSLWRNILLLLGWKLLLFPDPGIRLRARVLALVSLILLSGDRPCARAQCQP